MADDVDTSTEVAEATQATQAQQATESDQSAQTESQTEADAKPDGEQQPDTKAKPQEDDEPKWLQKRIDRAARKQHEAEREAAVLRQMLEMERQNKAQQTQQSRTPTADEFDRMTPAQQAALVAAEVARRAVEEDRARTTQSQKDAEAARQAAEVTRAAQKQLAVGSKKYEDFEEVALSEEVPISQTMAQAIAESEHGADIAYFLGKNLKEAHRISQLAPLTAAREIGRLEAKFAATTTVSKAPPPGKPVGARGGASGGLRDDMPLSEWMQQFDKSMRAR